MVSARGDRVFGGWRRRRRIAKVKPGDGSVLRRYRGWQVLSRSVFEIEHAADDYALDVNYLDFDDKARLYRNGVQVAVSEMPAAFPVPGGVIEAASTLYGMKRAHLVLDDGEERQLHPAPGTGEAWRAALGRRHPGLSAVLAGGAVVVLLLALVLGVPQILEAVTQLPLVAEYWTFTSPLTLPSWANTTLVVAGVLAATERALTLRNHWLIDADTLWFDA